MQLSIRHDLRHAATLLATTIAILVSNHLAVAAEELYVSKVFTAPGSFTTGIEGPAVDADGNVYAVNYEKQTTIGKVTPDGQCSIFVTLPNGSVGNGIRFDRQGTMFVADHVNHNVLKVDMDTRAISVHVHEPTMNQPNDLAIDGNGILYCSDPKWGDGTGNIWRVTPDGKATRLESKMGTTNGIEVSLDGRTLYVNESIQRNVWAYDLSASGDVTNKRLLIKFPDFGMDGMRCDADGNLYITRYEKGAVAIVSQGGKLLREVKLTGKNPSNIAFGGPDGRTCYVTLADQGNIETFRTAIPGRAWTIRQMQKDAGTAKSPENQTFIPHVIDTQFGALGADLGDRDAAGMAAIVACAGNEVYRYTDSEKHLIYKVDGPANCIHLRTADIDRDGDVDAIVADHPNGVRYLENPGKGSAGQQQWAHHFVDPECIGAHAVALADINRDGRIDVVASGEATSTPPDSIYWFECPTDPNRAAKWTKHVLGPGQSGGLAHYPVIGDVNGDGRLDVVHAAKKGEWYRLWTQPADATRPWKFSVVGTDYIQATNVQIGDIDGDGIADILASQGHHFGVLWFKGPDWQPQIIDKQLNSPHTLVLEDLDGDGDLDGATCGYLSTTLVWFENDGKGHFQTHVISENQQAYDLVARDVDGDGDLDLVVAGQRSNNVVWYERAGRPE
jgi:gluconolactonase